jgi:hypothetical protein
MKTFHCTPQIEYLIKWQGYNDKNNSYEPVENILDESLINEYEAEVGFNRKLPLEAIHYALRTSKGELIHVVSFVGCDVFDIVSAKVTNILYPQVVIAFYNDRLVFNDD